MLIFWSQGHVVTVTGLGSLVKTRACTLFGEILKFLHRVGFCYERLLSLDCIYHLVQFK